MAAPEQQPVEFTTLGMFIVDQIHYGPASARQVVDNIIGGAGTYGIVGARLFSPPPQHTRRLGWIVDRGHDFPPSCAAALHALDTRLVLRDTPERATTRGWNSYGDNDHRAFRYLTPKLRLEADDLQREGLAQARSVHLICSPERAEGVVGKLREYAAAAGVEADSSSGAEVGAGAGQIRVWEPVPDLCAPEYCTGLLHTAKLVDVVSPNVEELSSFFSDDAAIAAALSSAATAETLAQRLLASGVGPTGSGAVVVRAGKQGCLVASRVTGCVWLPAFYRSPQSDEGRNHEKVVDPTGGGNAFIGGLAVGLVRTRDVVRASAMGIVAASFAIEQIGIPTLQRIDAGAGTGGETWNGVAVADRMREYAAIAGRRWIVKNDSRMGLVYEEDG